jgi:thiamine pyrophosphate-dependent acetolactate synthase large subunit-like protein
LNIWEQPLIACGGNAMLLVVLGFLARSLLQTWLTKDIKRFETDLKRTADYELETLKAKLKAKGDNSIEALKSQLQQIAFEHQVRFSKLHEKRAKVTAELYKRAVAARAVSKRYVAVISAHAKEEQIYTGGFSTVYKTMLDFYEFFEQHRIYFPEQVGHLLTRFLLPLSSQSSAFLCTPSGNRARSTIFRPRFAERPQ